MDTIVSFLTDNLIAVIITLISSIIGLISLIDNITHRRKNSRKIRKEYEEATKNLKIEIEGKWYSAEFDLKHGLKKKDWANAILEIEIKREKSGNEIEIITGTQLIDSKRETGWIANGKVVTENTLSLDWKGTIEGSTRYGNCFMQFLDFGRAIGYWIGYASSEDGLPVYGYWILSRNEDEVKELAKLALDKFHFINVKDLVQKKV